MWRCGSLAYRCVVVRGRRNSVFRRNKMDCSKKVLVYSEQFSIKVAPFYLSVCQSFIRWNVRLQTSNIDMTFCSTCCFAPKLKIQMLIGVKKGRREPRASSTSKYGCMVENRRRLYADKFRRAPAAASLRLLGCMFCTGAIDNQTDPFRAASKIAKPLHDDRPRSKVHSGQATNQVAVWGGTERTRRKEEKERIANAKLRFVSTVVIMEGSNGRHLAACFWPVSIIAGKIAKKKRKKTCKM